jgi:hypothetical protein
MLSIELTTETRLSATIQETRVRWAVFARFYQFGWIVREDLRIRESTRRLPRLPHVKIFVIGRGGDLEAFFGGCANNGRTQIQHRNIISTG